MKYIALFLVLLTATLTSCDKVDDERIPPIPVYLNFNNTGLWNTYGVSGYGHYRFFSRENGIPANYSYKINDYTGFGGVMLIYGIDGPLAYDRACPVEAKKDVGLYIDEDNFEAYCKKCGSRYNVCEAFGAPVSGEAVDKKFGLRRINVLPSGGGYIISSR